MGSKLPSLEHRCPRSCGRGTCSSPVLCLVVPFGFYEGFGDRRAEALLLPRVPPSAEPRPPAPGRPQQGGSRGCPGRTRWRTGPEPGRLTSVQKVTNGGKEARAGPGTRLETSLLESTWAGVAVLLVSCPNGGHSFGLLSVYSPPDRPEPLLGAAPVSSGVGPTRSPCHSCGNRVTGRSLPPGSEPGFEPMSSDCSHVLCPPQPELG